MAKSKLVEQSVLVPAQLPTIDTSHERILAFLDASRVVAIYLRPDAEEGFRFEHAVNGEDAHSLAALEILRESTQGDDSFASSVAAILASLGSGNDLVLFICTSLVQQSAHTRLIELLGDQANEVRALGHRRRVH